MRHMARVSKCYPTHSRYVVEERNCGLMLRGIELAVVDKRWSTDLRQDWDTAVLAQGAVVHPRGRALPTGCQHCGRGREEKEEKLHRPPDCRIFFLIFQIRRQVCGPWVGTTQEGLAKLSVCVLILG